MSFLDAMRSEIVELSHLRDNKIQEGIQKKDFLDLAEGIGLSLLPLDLAKVAVGGAEKPSDYLWAGVDAITLLPFLRVGKLAEVAFTGGKVIKYGILGGAGAGVAYALSSNINESENMDIRKKAQEAFIKYYHSDIITLDVTNKVKQVYPDVEFARLTIYANDISKIVPIAVYNTTPPPRDINEIVKGWENGIELQRMKIGNYWYYIGFPCKLEMRRNKTKMNKTNYAIAVILIIIIALIGYYIRKKG
ncbi:hypothetical protein ACO3VM_09415 (plasmid) [Methanocaldococcus sp. 10A]